MCKRITVKKSQLFVISILYLLYLIAAIAIFFMIRTVFLFLFQLLVPAIVLTEDVTQTTAVWSVLPSGSGTAVTNAVPHPVAIPLSRRTT